MIAQILICLSAGIILLLGTVHLIYTFSGNKLKPRHPSLQSQMEQVSPVITSQTSMWQAWIGFNASHSLGAILFGLVYGYLALVHPVLLFHSWFLLGTGLVMLFSLLALATCYWFSIPFRGICLATLSFLAGTISFWWAT
ncbi:LIC_13387 family protein [Bowmanella dokdonensis]|uniref:Uncharacterized protein n=1 Tax=Bowmanella dokdonensis TaxID=751969 RepID=A0A939DMS0_9ALTE|nr:hypothetical protein [Bowmanella dokdonensis]MBN7825444.1 hypothetical protein [Bowmanella dokdonensis]